MKKSKGIIKDPNQKITLVTAFKKVCKVLATPFIWTGKLLHELSDAISDEDKMDSIDSFNMDFMDND